MLSAGLCSNPEFRARFVREADVASRLTHPNIVSVYSRGEADGQLLIAVHIVAEAAKGLDYAHRHNVVHRDIKPGNRRRGSPIGCPACRRRWTA